MKKFDIQLRHGLTREGKLKGILEGKTIELKTEQVQWEQTGNICVEYEHNDKPSGIAATEADYWCHELCAADGRTLVYMLFPRERMKWLARRNFKSGKRCGGDGGKSRVVVIPLADLFRP